MKQQLALVIKDLRIQLGISRSDLAKSIKKPKGRVIAIEMGYADLSITELVGISVAFDVPVSILILAASPVDSLAEHHEEYLTDLCYEVISQRKKG